MNYIINDVVIVVLAQIVNESVVEKEQSQNTKAQQLMKKISRRKAGSQKLNQKHKSTETTDQQDFQGTQRDQVGGRLQLRLSQYMSAMLTLANCPNVGILTASFVGVGDSLRAPS